MPTNVTMKNFIVQLLNNHIPASYYYHNLSHTLYVEKKCLEIGRNEHCTKEELNLLTTAALWHDTGYIKTYQNHEEASCTLAKEYLPKYGLTTANINTICGMIMATKIPQKPKTKLEAIIADADLEYLGTENASTFAHQLFKEISALHLTKSAEDWNEIQINFLKAHHYFTNYCKQHKEPIKQAYLNSLSNHQI